MSGAARQIALFGTGALVASAPSAPAAEDPWAALPGTVERLPDGRIVYRDPRPNLVWKNLHASDGVFGEAAPSLRAKQGGGDWLVTVEAYHPGLARAQDIVRQHAQGQAAAETLLLELVRAGTAFCDAPEAPSAWQRGVVVEATSPQHLGERYVVAFGERAPTGDYAHVVRLDCAAEPVLLRIDGRHLRASGDQAVSWCGPRAAEVRALWEREQGRGPAVDRDGDHALVEARMGAMRALWWRMGHEIERDIQRVCGANANTAGGAPAQE